MSSAPTPRPVVVTAELVASVLTVHVEVGHEVQEGDTLLVVESMKMEMPIVAPAGGRVLEVGIAAGDIVQEGDLLVAIQP